MDSKPEVTNAIEQAKEALKLAKQALGMPNGDPYARDAVSAALASLQAAQPVATIQHSDPNDERDGLWLSLEDKQRLAKLPPGTQLFTSGHGMPIDIKALVDRFLGWKLPKDFAPDGGISFKREGDYVHPVYGRVVFEPVGTNLFTADQAKAMFEYVLASPLPQAAQPEQTREQNHIRDAAKMVAEREQIRGETLKDQIVDVLQNHGWDGRLLDCNYAEAADDIIDAIRSIQSQPASAGNRPCSEELRKAGKPYPRTCMACGLGPCRAAMAQKENDRG